VLVTQTNSGSPAVASAPILDSNSTAPTLLSAAQHACVRIESANASATQMPTASLRAIVPNLQTLNQLHLLDCGGDGAVVVDTVKAGQPVNLGNVLIDATTTPPAQPPPAANYGIRLLHAGRLMTNDNVTITGITELAGPNGFSAAIEAGDDSVLTITGYVSSTTSTPSLLVWKNRATGVHVTGHASATISGLASMSNTSTGNTAQHGLLCDASPTLGVATNLTLRHSLFLANKTHGVFVKGGASGGCAADLGDDTTDAGNIFNSTAQKNGNLGLCYTVVSAAGATATSSTWGCNLASGVDCTSAAVSSPLPIVATGCDQVGDYNKQPATGGVTVPLPQTCCGQ
jgi:hypothetical protein